MFSARLLFILEQADVISLRPGDLISAVTYTINYHHDRAWDAGHLWSLSVEEQFYLMSGRRPAVRRGPRRAVGGGGGGC